MSFLSDILEKFYGPKPGIDVPLKPTISKYDLKREIILPKTLIRIGWRTDYFYTSGERICEGDIILVKKEYANFEKGEIEYIPYDKGVIAFLPELRTHVSLKRKDAKYYDILDSFEYDYERDCRFTVQKEGQLKTENEEFDELIKEFYVAQYEDYKRRQNKKD